MLPEAREVLPALAFRCRTHTGSPVSAQLPAVCLAAGFQGLLRRRKHTQAVVADLQNGGSCLSPGSLSDELCTWDALEITQSSPIATLPRCCGAGAQTSGVSSSTTAPWVIACRATSPLPDCCVMPRASMPLARNSSSASRPLEPC